MDTDLGGAHANRVVTGSDCNIGEFVQRNRGFALVRILFSNAH
jgi:hypothetical protein